MKNGRIINSQIRSAIFAINIVVLQLVLIGFSFLYLSTQASAQAVSSETVSFQGKIVLNSAGNEGLNVSTASTSCVVSGADTCRFKVSYYTDGTGTTLMGSETFTNVELGNYDGVFNLALGTQTFTAGTVSSFTEIFTSGADNVYMRVEFAPDGVNLTENFGLMAMRATPFALSAKYIGGMTADDFVKFGPSAAQVNSGTNASIFINNTSTASLLNLQLNGSSAFFVGNNGRVGIGTDSPNEQLEITGNFRFPQTTATTGALYMDGNRFIHAYKHVGGEGYNTFVGINSGNFTMTSATAWKASYNTGVGFETLMSLTDGNNNVALGTRALKANTTGIANVALGMNSLFNNTSGGFNVAAGQGSMSANLTGSFNTAYGNGTLGSNTTGSANTAIGYNALFVATNTNNSTLGYESLRYLTTGIDNTALGYRAGHRVVTGNNNVFLGDTAGQFLNGASSGNVFIGFNTGPTTATAISNQLYIHNNSGLTPLIWGDFANSQVRVNGNFALNANSYFNFGSTFGTSGYGFRDNTGILEFKNSAGSWTAFGSGGTSTFLGLTDTPASYTAGSILFTTGSAVSQNNAMFFWDNANYRLGLGTTLPLELLDVNGRIYIANSSAPTTTTNRLYAIAGNLYWNGMQLSGAGGQILTTTGTVDSGDYLELVHNLDTSTLLASSWYYDTDDSRWKETSEKTNTLKHAIDKEWLMANKDTNVRTTIRQTNLELANSLDLGSGADGAITVTSSANHNTTDFISGRVCADGGDAVNYSVTELTSDTATLSTSPSSSCLKIGDEVLLINLQGTTSAYANVGNYETFRVTNISSNVITFDKPKVKFYGDAAGLDTNLGTGTSNQRVMLQRVPNYTNVTINSGATLSSSNYNAVKGGVIFFRATGTVSVVGAISTNSAGYRAGPQTSGDVAGVQGESRHRYGVTSTAANLGGGGGAPLGAKGGGGGGHDAAGTAGASGGGAGGTSYNSDFPNTLMFGSGGGSGAPLAGWGAVGRAGGRGGGIVYVSANTLSSSGNIYAQGQAGTPATTTQGGSGGGGAGGSIILHYKSGSIGSNLVRADGGAGGNAGGVGGAGSDGKIAIFYADSTTGTTNPGATLASAPYYNYGVYHSPIIPLDEASSLNSMRWEQNGKGKVSLQTRTGVPVEAPVDANVVGLWRLNETSGTTVADASASANTGTITGAVSSLGRVNGSMRFDGESDYISVPDSASLDLTSAITVEAWIKPEKLVGFQTIAAKRDLSTYNYVFRMNNSSLTFHFLGAGSVLHQATTVTDVIEEDKWQHVAVTYDTSTVKFYVNGMLVSSSCINGTCTGSMLTDANPLMIGNGNGVTDQYFRGFIDEVRLSNVVRSQSDIVANMISWNSWSPNANKSTCTAPNCILVRAESPLYSGVWTVGSGYTSVAGDLTRFVPGYEDDSQWTASHTTKLTLTTAGSYAETRFGGSPVDISESDYLTLWVNASQIGNSVKIGFGESLATENERTITIDKASTWQKVYIDLDNVPRSSRDAITRIHITNLTSASNVIRVGYVYGEKHFNNNSFAPISSAPNDLFQYRFIMSTTDTFYRPQIYGVYLNYSSGFSVVQVDSNTVRLYNNTGRTYNLKLNLTGSGIESLASLWYDSGTFTYLASGTDDIVIGGTTTASNSFMIDVSTNTFTFGNNLSSNPTLVFNATDGDTGSFGFNTNDAFYFSGANVGIGTTNPSQALEVVGNVRFSGALMPGNSAGTAGQFLISAGPGSTPTWTSTIGATSVPWSGLLGPTANTSINHGTYTTVFDWATGTSTNNLFSLTTAASSNGTGSLLNIQTGTSSTVSPLRVRSGSVESIFVDNAGRVGIGTISLISTNKLSILASGGQTTAIRASGASGGSAVEAINGSTDWAFYSSLGRNYFAGDTAIGTTSIDGKLNIYTSNGGQKGININSVAGGWAVYAGTGVNYFGGNVGIGNTSPSAKFQIDLDSATTNTSIEISRYNRLTTGTAAPYIGQFMSFYNETANGSMMESGRLQFDSHIVANGAAGTEATNNASRFRVYVERQQWNEMIPVIGAYATGGDRFICMNGIELDAVGSWDCFGMAIGGANTVNFAFDGATRFAFDYGGDGANIVSMRSGNISDELKFKTLGTKPIYFDTSNNGTDMFISSDGRVGIGTAAPDFSLQVRNDGNGANWYGRAGTANSTIDKQVFLGTYGSTGVAGVFAHNNALNAWAPLYLNTIDGSDTGSGGNVIMKGNVGIGTPNPDRTLEIKGYQNIFSATNFGSAAAARQLTIGESTNNVNYRLALGYFHNGVNATWTGSIQSTHAALGNNLAINPLGGNVGIGRIDPAFNLDVVGTIRATTTIYANANGAAYLCGGDDACLHDVNVGHTVGIISTSNPNYGALQLGSSTSGTQAYVLGYNGKVGIGLTNPQYALEVAGDIRANGGWLRTAGDTGWHSDSYGGGWYMTDANWIRSYGSKNIFQNTGIFRTDGTLQVGGSGGTLDVVNGGTFAYRTNVLFANTSGNVGVGTASPVSTLSVYRAPSNTLGTTSVGFNFNGSAEVWGFRVDAVEYNLHLDRAWNGWQTPAFSINRQYGRVGFGLTAPGYRVDLPNTADVDGRGRANQWVTYSDARYKTDIVKIDNALATVLQLRGVHYSEINSGTFSTGFIAQEVYAVAPELVSIDNDGYMSLDYGRFTPYVVQALQEQNIVVASLSSRYDSTDPVSLINSRIAAIETQGSVNQGAIVTIGTEITELTQSVTDLQNSIASLDQGAGLGFWQYADTGISTAYSVSASSVYANEGVFAATETNLLNVAYGLFTIDNLGQVTVKGDIILEGGIIGLNGVVRFIDNIFAPKITSNQFEVENPIGFETAGSSTILSGETFITIETQSIKANSKVLVTPRSNTFGEVLYVGAITEGESFTVQINNPQAGGDILFDWWIIDTTLAPGSEEAVVEGGVIQAYLILI